MRAGFSVTLTSTPLTDHLVHRKIYGEVKLRIGQYPILRLRQSSSSQAGAGRQEEQIAEAQ
jgi:hypothetical protein